MPKKKASKVFHLSWLFDPLRDDPQYLEKRMFGALAAYFRGKMVLLISETEGDRSWKGQSYPFDIWFGLLLPTERENQDSIRQEYPSLVRHPVLPKWLYLPITEKNFEDIAMKIVECVLDEDPRFGIVPKIKNKSRKKVWKKKS